MGGRRAPDGYDAVVVGSGPNGLVAAVRIALAGRSVLVLEAHDRPGGGSRSAELTLPGLVHDVCAAVHPFGVASPALSALPLEDHGLVWRWPEVQLAHPLDGRDVHGDGRAGVLWRSIDETAAALGPDARRWTQVLDRLVAGFDPLARDVLGPVVGVPRHPLRLARFGALAALPATALARAFATEEAGALLAGSAAHSIRPLSAPLTSAIGLLLTAAGHAHGWPVAEGGSQAIVDALVSLLGSLGGRVECGVRVTDAAQLPPARAVLLDVAPRDALAIAGPRLSPGVRRSLERFRHGPGAFKVDLAVEGGVPWTSPAARRAGTVHVGGTVAELAAAESAAAAGRMPERPFVLVAQQHVADPTRVGDRTDGAVPVWAYAHVPHGFTGDATDAVLDQLERFAPGTRDRILARHVTGPVELEAYNPSYVGGDIATGANTVRQLVARPRLSSDPYTLAPGWYLCSAATPPGGGVHGMCGHHAAGRALAGLG